LLQPAFFLIVLALGIYGGLKIGGNASSPNLNRPATSIQLLNDFEAEPIESFLLDKL
jgi:hypothetical protein